MGEPKSGIKQNPSKSYVDNATVSNPSFQANVKQYFYAGEDIQMGSVVYADSTSGKLFVVDAPTRSRITKTYLTANSVKKGEKLTFKTIGSQYVLVRLESEGSGHDSQDDYQDDEYPTDNEFDEVILANCLVDLVDAGQKLVDALENLSKHFENKK